MLPNNPLSLRKVLNDKSQTPPGSCGYAYLLRQKDMLISDASVVGRFWEAEYDLLHDAWRVTSTGKQWHNGEVIEEFPIE